MKNKVQLMKAASVFSYICAGGYALAALWSFSMNESTYLLFGVLGLVSMYLGILTSGTREKLASSTLSKKDAIGYGVVTILSIVALPAFILNLIACMMHPTDRLPMAQREETVAKKNLTEGQKRKRYTVMITVSLCVVLMFSFLAVAVTTCGFQVEVTSHTLNKEMTETYNNTPLNGEVHVIDDPVLSYSYDIYKPKTASADNKAPVVFVMPGFTRTKQTQAQYCIELARRGFVVFCMDPGSQGGTTTAGYERDENGEYLLDNSGNRVPIGATTQANGLNYLVQYVYNNNEEFDYIDRSRIGATGHSAGGGNAATLAKTFAGESFEESVIKALYISGYIKVSSTNSYKSLNCNAVLDYAAWDEGRYRYQDALESFETAAMRFINEINGAPQNHDSFLLDYGYGSMEDGTYRMIHNDKQLHAFQPYAKASVANATQFFCDALKVETDLDANDQIWWGREISTGIAMIAAFVFVIALSGLLLTTKFFASVKGEKIKPIRKQNTSDKVIFWSAMVLTAVIACLDYIPLASLSIQLFPDAHATRATYFFPARMINAVLLWAVVNGTIGLVVFFATSLLKNLFEKFQARKEGRPADYDFEQYRAMKIGFVPFLKTLLLAVVLFAAFYCSVQVVYWLFGVDYRFMFISASPLKPRFVVTWLMYVPLFFIFYISNSIRVNCSMRFENWAEWKRMLVGGLANSLGLVGILVVQYVAFFNTGIVHYTYSASGSEVWLFVNIVFGLIPLMFVLPILNRIFYKQTNRVWLGAMTVCMIFIMMSLSASVSYIPM